MGFGESQELSSFAVLFWESYLIQQASDFLFLFYFILFLLLQSLLYRHTIQIK